MPSEERQGATTQNEDLEKRVNRPSWYTQHPSGIECIELIEHLPPNIANAVKYIWRCGLKSTETQLREMKSARWYIEREIRRVELHDLDDDPPLRTDIIWRALARRVIESSSCSGSLGTCLDALLRRNLEEMLQAIDSAILEIEKQ